MDPKQDQDSGSSDDDCNPELAAAISSAVNSFQSHIITNTQEVTDDKWDPELIDALNRTIEVCKT